MNFIADTYQELLEHVNSLKIDVPPRGDGRTTDHCEQWQVHQLLLALIQDKLISAPFKLTKRESPDFEIEFNHKLFGLEATEAINSDYARMSTLPEAKDQNSVLDPSLFKWNQKKRSTDTLRKIASHTKLTGSGWAGDSVEVEFAVSILDCVSKKHVKLLKGFDRYTNECLLIYHNHSTPALDLEKGIDITVQRLKDYWGSGFNYVIVHKYDNVCIFTKNSVRVISIKS